VPFNFRKILLAFLVLAFLFVIHPKILTWIGSVLVVEDIPAEAAAAVVLNTGVDIYPRLIEAADLYREGRVQKVVINGNRKTDILRQLESNGYTPPFKWYAEHLAILASLGVPRDDIIAISAEDAYDTISEARIVGATLLNNGMAKVIITTSKFHSRRARHIWKSLYGKKLAIHIAPARSDPFAPSSWWKSGRQIRWVLSEYGAWVFYYWNKINV
jgi:uncharacterized SAM-binding protein YcdF (DUF218 family)